MATGHLSQNELEVVELWEGVSDIYPKYVSLRCYVNYWLQSVTITVTCEVYDVCRPG